MWNWFAGRAPRPSDAEIARELHDHLELEAEALATRGFGPEAATAARRTFGNATLVAESVHEVWSWTWLEQLREDARQALRGLRRSPAYTISAALTLGLGIGAATAVFSLAFAVLQRPFPLLPQERLLWVVQRSRQCPTCDNASAAAFLTLRSEPRTMSEVAAAMGTRATVRGTEGTELVEAYATSANIFSTIEAPFALGHGFSPDADQPGHDDEVVLSWPYWHGRFAGSRGVLDSLVVVDGRARRVVGVLARGLSFPMAADVYRPLVLTAADANDHASRYLDLFARLAPGTTVQSADREAAAVSRQLAAAAPRTDAEWVLVPRPLAQFHSDDVRPLIRIMAVAVALTLLAACVSVANLALARAAARRRELALRAALGARRAQLVRHLLVEALLVSTSGALLGVGLAAWGVRRMQGAVPASLSRFAPGWAGAHVDAHALGFALLVCIAAMLLFALLPAVRATRVDLSSVLSEDSRGSAGGVHGTRLRATLVVLEVSTALVLLAGATLLARSVRNMLTGDPGIRVDHVLAMHLVLPNGLRDSAARAVLANLDERLHAERGVLGAGLASTTPLSNESRGTSFEVPGRAPAPDGQPLRATDQRVSPDYFRTMNIRVLAGRGLEPRDVDGAPRIVVVNRHLADLIWPGADAPGRVLRIDGETWTVVGVVSNVRHHGFEEPVRPEVYRSVQQALSNEMALHVWTAGDPSAAFGAIRRAVAAADPGIALGDVMTMREIEARHVSPFTLMAAVLLVFAAVTTIIALVGLYGVIAYGVALRTRELGVRVALGAQRRDIVLHVAAGALRLTTVGVMAGIVAAFGFAQLLRSMLYGVTASAPGTPALVGALLLVAALGAAVLPAWRASRVSPLLALRE